MLLDPKLTYATQIFKLMPNFKNKFDLVFVSILFLINQTITDTYLPYIGIAFFIVFTIKTVYTKREKRALPLYLQITHYHVLIVGKLSE